jgi:uncharacterized protein YbjT (DUF2867 family)
VTHANESTSAKTALIAGATGLIGGQLLDLILKDSYYQKVIAISRRPLTIRHDKLVNVVFEYENLKDFVNQLKADDVFCCLGTTIRQAGSKEAFRKIDYDYPKEIGWVTKANGAKQYLLVSALGADITSRIFYNRIKGEIELMINETGFECVHILRPSLLIGPRIEKRAGEDAAKVIYKYLDFLIPLKYKGIESLKVARAMIALAKQNRKGNFIHESGQLQSY